VVRAWYRTTGLRPGSAPFVSGDSFRAFADLVLERGRPLDPRTIRAGAVVFVEAGQLPVFKREVLPLVSESFVLITHNGDVNIGGSYRDLAQDARLIRWFAQNALLRHPKVTPIPIGLENRFYHTNGVEHDFRVLRKQGVPKLMRVLFGFTTGTNERERAPALAALRASPLADFRERTNSRDYRRCLQRYAFVASPPGNGVDCHRTWEALYLRTVPVVKRSVLYDAFPGLPVLPVDDWSEIAGWEPSFLEREYEKRSALIDAIPFLKFDYWADLIRGSRAN